MKASRTRKPVYRIRRAHRRFRRWARMDPHGDLSEENIRRHMNRWVDRTHALLDKFFPGRNRVEVMLKILNREIR